MFPGPPDEPHSQEVLKVLLLVSSWINICLYTLELVMCRRYFQCPNRLPLYKAGVCTLIFFDSICTLTVCVSACFAVLGNPPGEDIGVSMSPVSVTVFMTYCSAAVEQAVLSHLYFALTGNVFVTACLVLLILVHMGFAFASAALIVVFNSELSGALMTTTVSAITCAVTDIFLAICLGFKVWQMLSPRDVITPTHSFVRKFFLLILSAGLIVASNTMVMMALLVSKTYVSMFFLSYQGRVYSLALLANFLVGIHFRRDDTTDGTSRREPTTHVTFTGVLFRDLGESGVKSSAPDSASAAESELIPPGNLPSMQEYDKRPSLRVRSQP
ncbi:hypothetical protein FB451DRAFT_1454552 [Mycena latifolia]|nr:hypothetical protein FB451DRAFT_1454552 [Mycena latifolia]